MKQTISIIVFLIWPSIAFAQGAMTAPQVALQTVNGVTRPIANATITVCAAGASGIPCAPALTGTIFKDVALGQALANPFASDASGNYQFAAAPGTYTVTVTAAGFAGNSQQVTLSPVPGSSNTWTGNNTWNGTSTFNGSMTLPVTGNAALKGNVNEARCFVSPNGNDIQDCQSWGSAKLTIQAGLNALPTVGALAGGMVYLACGAYSYSSTLIAPSTSGPLYSIKSDCPVQQDDDSGGNNKLIALNYTGTTGNAIQTAGFASLENLYFVGAGRGNSTVGIDCNAPGTQFLRLNISHFGTGFGIDSHCFLTTFDKGSIHDNATQLGVIGTPVGTGENLKWLNTLFSDTATNSTQTCVNLVTLSGGDFIFNGDSFDTCPIEWNIAGLGAFAYDHFEQSNTGTHANAIQIDHNQSVINCTGCDFLQNHGSGDAAQFVVNNSNLGNYLNFNSVSFRAGASVSMTSAIKGNGGTSAVANLSGINASGTFTSGAITGAVGTLWGVVNYSDLDQQGSCTMAAATTCTFTVPFIYVSTPVTNAFLDSTATPPAAAISAKCVIASTTVTITAGASNSLKWDCTLQPNPD